MRRMLLLMALLCFALLMSLFVVPIAVVGLDLSPDLLRAARRELPSASLTRVRFSWVSPSAIASWQN